MGKAGCRLQHREPVAPWLSSPSPPCPCKFPLPPPFSPPYLPRVPEVLLQGHHVGRLLAPRLPPKPGIELREPVGHGVCVGGGAALGPEKQLVEQLCVWGGVGGGGGTAGIEVRGRAALGPEKQLVKQLCVCVWGGGTAQRRLSGPIKV